MKHEVALNGNTHAKYMDIKTAQYCKCTQLLSTSVRNRDFVVTCYSTLHYHHQNSTFPENCMEDETHLLLFICAVHTDMNTGTYKHEQR